MSSLELHLYFVCLLASFDSLTGLPVSPKDSDPGTHYVTDHKATYHLISIVQYRWILRDNAAVARVVISTSAQRQVGIHCANASRCNLLVFYGALLVVSYFSGAV
jgi:hypothetical protein